MLVTHRQCMTPVATGNTNPVTLISYSFVGLGPRLRTCSDVILRGMFTSRALPQVTAFI